MGRLIRCITSDGCVTAMAVDTTDIVNEAVRLHETSAVVSAALGRLLTAASMMGSALKSSVGSVTLLRTSGRCHIHTVAVAGGFDHLGLKVFATLAIMPLLAVFGTGGVGRLQHQRVQRHALGNAGLLRYHVYRRPAGGSRHPPLRKAGDFHRYAFRCVTACREESRHRLAV